jgi:hypothetical protein
VILNQPILTVRGFAERNAINSPIQGTAADNDQTRHAKSACGMKKEKMQSKSICYRYMMSLSLTPEIRSKRIKTIDY